MIGERRAVGARRCPRCGSWPVVIPGIYGGYCLGCPCSSERFSSTESWNRYAWPDLREATMEER
jgi:hypothetical protein